MKCQNWTVEVTWSHLKHFFPLQVALVKCEQTRIKLHAETITLTENIPCFSHPFLTIVAHFNWLLRSPKSCKQDPRAGLVSRVSVSKWSYLSSTAIMSFFTLLQEKKRQLQPLSSRHLLLSCGEEVWWSILGLNKQYNKASPITFRHDFIQPLKALSAQGKS